MMAGPVGNRVRGSVEDRSESHGDSGYAIDSTARWHWLVVAMAAVWGAWAFEHGPSSALQRGGWPMLATLPWVVVRPVASRERLRSTSMVVVLVIGLVGWRSTSEWNAVRTVAFGDVSTVATLASDPESFGRGTRVVLSIEGRRFEAVVYGSIAAGVSGLKRGESVRVEGRTREVREERRRRSQVRHIVGEIEVESFSDPAGGPRRRSRALERSANDVRDVMSRGAGAMNDDDSALFAGLVYGDDSDQSEDTVERFRASGLAHLTAVSGQNVGYLLAVLAPMTRRRGRWTRMSVTLGALVWFAVLTRVEPSVVRASGMAAVSAVALAIGWRPRAIGVLSLCVIIFLFVDPFLAWSVGWWLSAAGTFGLVMGTPAIHRVLRGSNSRRRRVADWMAPTIAAQLGVLPVSVAVFGWPSALALPANLLAAPVAGLVMLVGIPAALVAGSFPALSEPSMFLPSLAVRWVDAVARVAANLEPPPFLNVVVTSMVPFALVLMERRNRHRCANLG